MIHRQLCRLYAHLTALAYRLTPDKPGFLEVHRRMDIVSCCLFVNYKLNILNIMGYKIIH